MLDQQHQHSNCSGKPLAVQFLGLGVTREDSKTFCKNSIKGYKTVEIEGISEG